LKTITDRDIKRAAVLKAAGIQVITIKLTCSPRCAFEYVGSPEVNGLLDAYESREVLPIPQKAIMRAHGVLLGECKALKQGAL
jgi:hypothetical protein